jgi:hypothetical protein
MSHIQEGGEGRRDINVPERIVREEGGEKMKEKEEEERKVGRLERHFISESCIFNPFLTISLSKFSGPKLCDWSSFR